MAGKLITGSMAAQNTGLHMEHGDSTAFKLFMHLTHKVGGNHFAFDPETHDVHGITDHGKAVIGAVKKRIGERVDASTKFMDDLSAKFNTPEPEAPKTGADAHEALKQKAIAQAKE